MSPPAARVLLAAALACAVAAGWLATGSDSAAASAMAQAGPDLTHLLRAMAALKTLMVAGTAFAVFWRAGTGMTLAWLAAYAAALACMGAGPPLIWAMAHVRLGAAFLHGGLLATIILLWRDPAVGKRLDALVAARRMVLARRSSPG